ncbi:MAG TPA: aspartate kinase [Verrucomicrobiae bacterium]|nr:aspartate kinase [Verrucomicrobiae bacterium]
MSGRQSRFESSDDVVVMKFGGSSVEDAEAIRRLISTVQGCQGCQRVIVVSALGGVTDQLLEAGKAAANGRLGLALELVRRIYVRHERLAEELVGGGADLELERELRAEFQRLEALLLELNAPQEFDLKARDHLLGIGERLSSLLIAAAMSHAEIRATHVDAAACVVTDSRHGQANPLWDVTNQRLQAALGPLLESGRVPVLGGFIASTLEAVPTTLGRGGSDFTATIVGAALSAARIEIWTDVDGVMTTDPKLCAEARVIRKISFDEAAELAYFGAKVLHPATLAPVVREGIPVYVRNSRNPQAEGTEIAARARTGNAVSAITAKRNVAAVEVESALEVSNMLHLVYAAFDRHGCPVDVMATSFGQMSLLVRATEALPQIAAELKDVANVRWENHRALVCLVGEKVRRHPDVASRAFATVADMDVRVVCQGASDRTISFLVHESKVEESVQRLHAVFFPRREAAADWGGISTAFCHAG